ncbi:MAG: YggS family pyridoxal phosphate-dependent enzyme [Anaerolineae bacterium]|nr:YggS family pyridoxal phosphate-dependent enzyme [Anaerolineae bacterium]MDW8071089.1 YggS family pyridoxal phosphate-dependent enzyme [Anaerolineae bacterium]
MEEGFSTSGSTALFATDVMAEQVAHALAVNLERVQARIAAAAQRVGRSPQEIILVAVTKTQPVRVVQAAYCLGVRHFGENRVEEGIPKIKALTETLGAITSPYERPVWHMIGHIQHRKTAQAVLFDMIHSLDSLRLAERLEARAAASERVVPVLLECNVSGEASKYGFSLADWQRDRAIRAEFVQTVRTISRLPHLKLQGLMTMAPIVSVAELARPVFASLRALREVLRQELPDIDWQHLSMGMTDDFEVAIEEGATLVRIGRAIFGER